MRYTPNRELSKGRGRRYAYYHCRKCRTVKVSKEALETKFIALVEALQPEPAFARLFNAIVLDVWRGEQRERVNARSSLERRVADLRSRLERVEDAFPYERTIDLQTYAAQRDKLREQVALAELELSEARMD